MRSPQKKEGSQPFELSANIKTCAKPPQIYFAPSGSSTIWISTLSLQNEFLRRDSGGRFSVAWRAARTTLIIETSLNESFEKRMRFVRLALKFRVILATNKIGMITKIDQLGQRSVRGVSGNDKPFLFIPL